jgi:uncharacterized protein YciI
MTRHLLLYEYVPDILERRGPLREQHLALIQRWHEAGEIELAGGLGDPPTGGAMIFRVADSARIEEFIAEDPYVSAGLVTRWSARPWTIVTDSTP